MKLTIYDTDYYMTYVGDANEREDLGIVFLQDYIQLKTPVLQEHPDGTVEMQDPARLYFLAKKGEQLLCGLKAIPLERIVGKELVSDERLDEIQEMLSK